MIVGPEMGRTAAVLERLIDCFEMLSDPRDPCKVEHHLVDILVIAVCAVLGEAESFEAIADYGRGKEAWLRRFLTLPNGIPSHDTFRRVLTLVDPDGFERGFARWAQAAFPPGEAEPGRLAHVAVDGKALRRSSDRGKGWRPLRLVSAYAGGRGVALGQAVVPATAGEPAAAAVLLDGLDLRGCLVTLDAGFCQREIARRVRAKEADYLICLKANHRKLHAAVRGWFEAHCLGPGAPHPVPAHDAFDRGHGRLVRRRVFACHDLGALPGLRAWPDVRAVIAVEATRGLRRGYGKVTTEVRYFLTSAGLDPARLGEAVRRHWAIENGLHWVLDVTFDEDRCRVRGRRTARNLACLRKVALNLARADRFGGASLRRRRQRAAWDDTYMTRLIQADLMRSPCG